MSYLKNVENLRCILRPKEHPSWLVSKASFIIFFTFGKMGSFGGLGKTSRLQTSTFLVWVGSGPKK